MSLRARLQPYGAALLTSRSLQSARRAFFETRRRLRRRPHRILYFHQLDDPYSDLAAELLLPLLDRYGVELELHLVGPPPDEAAPERERLVAYSRRDAAAVAPHRGLRYRDPGRQPPEEALALARRILALPRPMREAASLASAVGAALWEGKESALAELAATCGVASESEASERQGAGEDLRRRLGHYLGATFYYEGEWYWGVDRLGHLEERLRGLGLSREPDTYFALLAPRFEVSGEPFADPHGLASRMRLEFFPSLRSPYSYIAMERTLALAAASGVSLELRPVLPMVMRGLPVPAAKRLYITLDTAREARALGIAFGTIADPVGRPIERAFSLYPLACERRVAGAYLLSFARAAFAEGVPTGTDEGLRLVAERAGLDWSEASRVLDTPGWREALEANREEMFDAGLWGVPSFRLSGPEDRSEAFTTWGQDRLWLVEKEIRRRLAEKAPAGGETAAGEKT